MTVTVASIFNKAQLSNVYHNKLLQRLLELFEEANPMEFQKTFVLCLKHTIVNGEKASAVRILDFVSKFCAKLESRKTEKRKEVDKQKDDEEKENEDEENEDEEEPMNPFVSDIFKELLKIHGCRSPSSRMRICYCIKRILQCLGPEASIDSEICEEIYAAMLERLKDKSPAVRVQAVTALERLQDPSDQDCPVVKAFIYHMSLDPSVEVRRAVLMCLGRSKHSLPYIRNRIHDIKDSVRKQAYLSLSKVTIRSHSIKNRELILSQGLKDRSDLVRDSVEKVLLPNWYENCQENFVEFLHALDVENSEIAEKATKVVFRQQSKEKLINTLELDTEKLIPPEKLTVELSFVWRCLAEFLQSEEDGQWELVLPELSLFCEYVKRNLDRFKEINKLENLEPWDHTQNDFIILQLLQLMEVFDLGDEAGREKLKQLLIDMLMSSDTRLKVIPSIINALVKVVPDVDTRLQLIAETISEIHDPLVEDEEDIPADQKRELDYKLAQLRLQKNIMEEDLEKAVEEKKYLVAEELKNSLAKITEDLQLLSVNSGSKESLVKNRKDDPGIISKCLTIVFEMMQSPTVKNLNPQLRSLLDNFVKNSLKIEHAVVQVIALQCLAVFSLLDESIAKEVIVIFCLYLGSTCDEISQVAVKGIFDLLLKYGLKTFAIREEDGDILDETLSPRKKLKKNLMRKSTLIIEESDDNESENGKNEDETEANKNESVETKEYHLLTLLIKHLDSSEGQMLSFVVQGLCKLLLAMRISAPKLLSRLILLWYNPVHEDDAYLRQILGHFFKSYATSCPLSQEVLEQCFIPTINTVLNAPPSSPLYQVDVETVAKFLLYLTKSGINRYSAEVNIHNNLALQVCNEALKDNYAQNKHEWINFLCQMELVLDDDLKKNLKKMIDKIKIECPDKATARAIQKFQNILNGKPDRRQRVSESITGEVTASEQINLTQTASRLSSKRGSSLIGSDGGSTESDASFTRSKALRTGSSTMIPSSSELTGVIPETSESDNDSVFESGEE